MKIRTGFVSNSSSSSFIIKTQDKPDNKLWFEPITLRQLAEKAPRTIADNLQHRISRSFLLPE